MIFAMQIMVPLLQGLSLNVAPSKEGNLIYLDHLSTSGPAVASYMQCLIMTI